MTRDRGYTLIEMSIVMVIIGLVADSLAGIAGRTNRNGRRIIS